VYLWVLFLHLVGVALLAGAIGIEMLGTARVLASSPPSMPLGETRR